MNTMENRQMLTRILALLLLLTGCSSPDETGPGKIRWDQEVCERCAMAISDRNFAAQIRGGPAGERTRLYKFDDIGCAVVWLEKQAWKEDPRTEIWVADHRTGDWLDARKAWFLPGPHSPMGYNLGASAERQKDALDFDAAREHIWKVERGEHAMQGSGHEHHHDMEAAIQ